MSGTAAHNRLLIGTSGWSYPHWAGAFYPRDWPKTRWFAYYCSRFDTVEVNATFYRRFPEQTYRNWRAKAPPGFRYVLKAPKRITHRRRLLDVDDEIRAFAHSAALLGEKLGLILLQLPPSLPVEPDRLRHALRCFDDPGRVAVEFRDPAWLTPETFALLRELGAVFCSADSPRTPLLGQVTGKTG